MKKHLSLLFLLSILSFGHLLAQKKLKSQPKESIYEQVTEKVFIHGNATTLLTGESFYYQFYTWNTYTQTLSEISKIGYIQLVNQNGKPILKQKLILKNGVGYGDFFIPTSLKTGSYKLVAYTKWMRNTSIDNMFQLDLWVINPFEVLPKKNRPSVAIKNEANYSDQKQEKQPTTNIFQLKKTTYSPREKVVLNLNKTHFPNGNYSISVRRKDNLPQKLSASAIHFLKKLKNKTSANVKTKNNQQFLPELRGQLVIGKIKNIVNPKDIANKNISLAIPGKNFVCRFSTTNKKGVFRFSINEFPQNPELIIQIMEKDRENYEIELVSSPINFTNLNFSKFKISEAIQEDLIYRSIAIQIENAYYKQKKDSILPENNFEPFFSPLEDIYVLDSYTRFPTIKKTLVEIIPAVYSVKEKGQYEIYTRDFRKNINDEVFGPALVMVDGLPLQNLNYLFDYSAKKIDKISVVSLGYLYGTKVYDGVVNFKTKKQDFKVNLTGSYILKKDFIHPFSKKIYYQPSYEENKNTRIPDYRYQLLWKPGISLGNKTQQERNISFYTSDIAGVFEISIEGFTENGKAVSATQTFKVN